MRKSAETTSAVPSANQPSALRKWPPTSPNAASAENNTRGTASVPDVLPALVAQVQTMARAVVGEPAAIVVRHVLGVHAHRAVTFDEVETRRELDRLVGARREHHVGHGRVLAQPEQRDVLRRCELDLTGFMRRE